MDGMPLVEASAQTCTDWECRRTIQAILRHANVSTTNTYYIKSAADDARAAMAKLERLIVGNENRTEDSEPEISESDNQVATTAAISKTAAIQ